MATYDKSLPGRRIAGFSLLEVLIALVVLSTGLLAITWLQASLTRSAAEAKMRSYAVGIAQEELERVRAQTTDIDEYVSLGNQGATIVPGSVAATGSQFTLSRTVTEYNQLPDGEQSCGTFPCFEVSSEGSADLTVPGYKMVAVEVSWTAADSQAADDKSITVSDNVSKLSLSGSSDVIGNDALVGESGPIIIASKASLGLDAAGVIPIITGGADGEATAATNPKPIVDNSTGTATVKFNLVNYQDGGTGNVLVQRQTETELLSCKCQYGSFGTGTGSALTTKMRPTYWTGTRYASPKTVASEGLTVPDSHAALKEYWGPADKYDRDIQQSPLCDICCRDHHDPVGVDTDDKFDPYLPTGLSHQHYIYPLDSSGNTTTTQVLVSPSSDDLYAESCRVIKVGGIWRTAVDMDAAHLSLLATNQVTTGSEKAWAPKSNAATAYVDFVNAYLAERLIIPGTPATAGNNVVTSSEITAMEDATTPSLNDPSVLGISTNTATKRYLHGRGLYVDLLSVKAIDYFNQRLESCTSGLECILSYIPFAPLNVTELAKWVFTSKISITNNMLDASDTAEPQRGVVTPVAAAVDDTATGTVQMFKSNSGLSFALPLDPYDGADLVTYPASRQKDDQQFKFSDSGNIESDVDSDGVEDDSDNCPSVPNPDQANNDLDLMGDACDTDDDNDGTLDGADNCPITANPDQADADSDGLGDICDPNPTSQDGDGDGVLDANDNCPVDTNADQADTDGDGIGDVCDTAVLLSYQVKLTATADLFSTNPAMHWDAFPSNGTPGGNCTVTSPNGATPLVYSCLGTSSDSQRLKVSGFNRIYIKPGPTTGSGNNDCRIGNGSNAIGPKNVDEVICVVYSPGILAPGGIVGNLSSTQAYSGTGLQSSITSTYPANNQFATYDVSGITDGGIFSATFTSKQINLKALGKDIGYTCDANGYPVYNFSQCK